MNGALRDWLRTWRVLLYHRHSTGRILYPAMVRDFPIELLVKKTREQDYRA